MMKGQPRFNTMETLRETEERPPRKKKGKPEEVSLVEPVPSPRHHLPLGRPGKVGYALSEAMGQIVNSYQVSDEEHSDEGDSGNEFRHEVSGLRVAAKKGAARFQTKKN